MLELAQSLPIKFIYARKKKGSQKVKIICLELHQNEFQSHDYNSGLLLPYLPPQQALWLCSVNKVDNLDSVIDIMDYLCRNTSL